MLTVSGIAFKILPLYINIILGFIGGKWLKIDRQSIARILFYLVVPVIFFDIGLKTDLSEKYLVLPFIILFMAIILCISYLYFSRLFWKDRRANLIAAAAGTGNSGYFGFPIALMLFEPKVVDIYMLANIGLCIYDYTLGAYMIARGRKGFIDALLEISGLPIIYAFLTGVILGNLGFTLPIGCCHLVEHMRGAYAILGMMIIGFGLSNTKFKKLEAKFLTVFLSAKFIAAPALTLLFISLDSMLLHMFTKNIHQALLLLSIVPPAANTVVLSNLYNCHPQEASIAVFIGTVLAAFYIPYMLILLI